MDRRPSANGIVSEADGDTAGRNGADLNIAGRNRPDGGTESDAAPALPPGIDPRTGRPRRFAYPPQLLVIDGGAPQVNAAAGALADIGVVDVAVCGLAKRLEEVWVPGQDEPVIFPRTSEALYLLQRLRDEAHRFAITFHREKRSKSMTVSALDAIAGRGTRPAEGADPALRLRGGAAPGECRAT